MPTGMILAFIWAGAFFKRWSMVWMGFILFWLCSTPLVSTSLARFSEGNAVHSDPMDMPVADAIVVLSEGRLVAPGKAAISEWRDGDRFWGGVDLYLAGKAPLLIFTNGWAPWLPESRPEGDVLIEFAKKLGVPGKSLLTTGHVTSTEEESLALATLLSERGFGSFSGQWPKVLLVTSANHMPRAQQLFENTGIKIIPYPVDFHVDAAKKLNVLDFFPSATAFMQTERIWRELLGRMFYFPKSSNTKKLL